MAGSNKRQRNRQANVRMTDAEDAALKTRADIAGLSVAAYFRLQALGTPPPRQARRPPIATKSLAVLLAHVGKIGSNVNQLAKWANSGGWPEQTEITRACADIRWMRDALVSVLGFGPRPGEDSPAPPS